MPRVKKAHFSALNKATNNLESVDVEIHINASGEFYAHVPEYLLPAIDSSFLDLRARWQVEGRTKVHASTLAALEECILKAFIAYLKPEITEEPVILYNIESHVSFAEDAEGNIFPNAGYPGAKWPGTESKVMFGEHHSTSPSRGGYSLTIGAKAMMKRTYKFGDNARVEYSQYYKGGSHLGKENPAELLNGWCSFSLGENPKEIPYTDEAALFFHNLLLGMATLSRKIQAATFHQANLLALIAKQPGPFLLADISGRNGCDE